MKKGFLKKMTASALAAMTVFSLAACGGEESAEPKKEWVYVPEFTQLQEEDVDYYDMKLVGDGLYYVSYEWNEETFTSSESLIRYSLTDGSTAEVPIIWTDTERDHNLGNYCVGADGSVYSIVYSYDMETYESQEMLVKFDATGKQVFEIDMTKYMEADPENSYANGMALDGEGRVYVSSNNVVWLFDAVGNYQGTVSVGSSANSWIQALGCGKNGKVYVSCYSYDGNSSGNTLTEINFEGKTAGATYANFPGGNSQTLIPGIEQEFMVHDGMSVYEYDLETQTKTKLFDWLDSDINGNSVQNFGVLADGRILVVINDWETDDSGLAYLTKTKAEEVPQKETIVFATMSGSSELQAAAVAFNKSNDTYRISIKQYVDYDSFSENTWSDAMTNLLNDITSKNCPDMIDLTGLNVSQLAAKDVFADLNTFLEKSAVLKREDFVENILKASTYNDKLVAIPAYFEMQTIVGATDKVGTEMGWTLQEMLEFAKKYPEAELFDNMTKSTMMYYLMMYNENLFIDWETGKCNFDTDEFKSLLTFLKDFPDEYRWEEGQPSTPTKIQNGEVLLDSAYVYNFESIQIYWEMFGGDVTCIGYPSANKSSGCALMTGQAYAITSKSKKQDGAWAFIESFLTREVDDWWYGFPTMKSELEAMKEEATKVEYYTDENGEPILDENGEPIVMGGGGGIGYEDGWEYTYTIPTQKEVDIIMSLMDVAQPVSMAASESQTTKIILEEAASFWAGQKSVEEAAAIIQSRIQIYVDENR